MIIEEIEEIKEEFNFVKENEENSNMRNQQEKQQIVPTENQDNDEQEITVDGENYETSEFISSSGVGGVNTKAYHLNGDQYSNNTNLDRVNNKVLIKNSHTKIIK